MTIANDDSALPTAPRTYHFDDIDHYRSSIRTLNVDFTPLARNITAKQVILSLPGCDINFTKSFPRVVDAELAPNCTAIGFSMDDHDVQIRFNGVDRDRAVIVAGSNGAAYNSVEHVERECASIIFAPSVENRGWPVVPSQFRIFETSLAAQRWLRELVHQVLAVSSDPASSPDGAARGAAMKESLLAGIDAAFADATVPGWAARGNSVRKFKVFRQIIAALHDDLANPVYSEELSKRLSLSVRTLHDAVQQYRGMSLHRYLRLRRLWLVRKQLLAGADSVKTAALDFGFWHLSDFSRGYRARFGETPSETLARGRKGSTT